MRPQRTGGNLRLYSALDEARVRLMTRHLAARLPAAQAAEMSLAASLSINVGSRGSIPAHTAQPAIRDLMSRVEAFDETAADQALQQLLVEFGPTAVLRDVFLPFMREVGNGWEAGTMSVAHEHFATHLIHSRLLALARGWDRGLGPQAILACAPGEQHVLGLITFGIAIHRLGWRITYLGAQTPVHCVSQTAQQVRPAAVVLCGVLRGAFHPHAPDLAVLASEFRVALAGRAADHAIAARCGAELLAGDPISAAGTLTCATPQP